MRLPIVFGTAALSILGVVATTSTAHAQDPAQPAAAAKPAEAPQKAEEEHKKISLEINPLAATLGRYSIQAEYLPVAHHAITLNPFFNYTPVKVNDKDAGNLTGFGGELGYRFYTGSKGPNGFFIGPSFIFASYTANPPDGAQGVASKSFTAIGGALDLGGQAVIGPGIVIGGGFGLQYTSNSEEIKTDDLNLAAITIAGGGVRPRFLLSLGYAF